MLDEFLDAYGLSIAHTSRSDSDSGYGCIVHLEDDRSASTWHEVEGTGSETESAALITSDFVEEMSESEAELWKLVKRDILPAASHPFLEVSRDITHENGRDSSSEGTSRESTCSEPVGQPGFYVIVDSSSYSNIESDAGYASATTAYGLSVDPVKLLYHARAWQECRYALAYISGLIDGKLQRDPASPYTLPNEILSYVKKSMWETAIQENTCFGWAYHGGKLAYDVHSPSCCQDVYLYWERMLSLRYIRGDGLLCDESVIDIWKNYHYDEQKDFEATCSFFNCFHCNEGECHCLGRNVCKVSLDPTIEVRTG